MFPLVAIFQRSEFYDFIDFIVKLMTYRYLKIRPGTEPQVSIWESAAASVKNSKRFRARASVGEMLFPSYFRPGTDKIDEKRLT